MTVKKVESGYIDDDFIHDRITLKAFLRSGNYMTCKLYGSGRLVSFAGSGDYYEERPIIGVLAEEIKAKLKESGGKTSA